jgi:hypothetical protein
MSYGNLSGVSQNLLKFYQLFTGEERRIPYFFDDFHFCRSRVIGLDMTENRIFTLCRMITWVVFFRMFWNFISSLPMKSNRFLHTFLGKTGWSSTSDRNFMSFREWSAAKRAKRHKNFYHKRKITRAFPTTHVSTYFFRKPTTFTIANS